MTATELKKHWQAVPFEEFNIILPGGEKIPVDHPELLSISPNGRIAIIWQGDDHWTRADVFLITAIEKKPRRRASKNLRRRKR